MGRLHDERGRMGGTGGRGGRMLGRRERKSRGEKERGLLKGCGRRGCVEREVCGGDDHLWRGGGVGGNDVGEGN